MLMCSGMDVTEVLTKHVPVLRDEVVEVLQAQNGGSYLDCTLGGGGHTESILEAHNANTVVALDRDAAAIERSRERLRSHQERLTMYHTTFGDVLSVTQGQHFDGMLVDLGLSTDQLKGERGFSFGDDTPLDMRMDQSQGLTADEIVNNYPERKLLSVLKRGGVGFEAQTVVRAIVRARPIKSTKELARVINQAQAGHARKKSINPATVTFQAIRIEVNDEFGEIAKVLDAAPQIVKQGGRLAVITFHSLEDKLVARKMRAWEQAGSEPANWRGIRGQSIGRAITRKPIIPSDSEVERNSASRSARMRVFEFNNKGGEIWQ